jgi:hypothetical protein
MSISSQTIAGLNRLSVLHSRSLPIYLQYTTPWVASGREDVTELLAQIAEDQQSVVGRIGSMILANHELVDAGEFPIDFTSLHDLSIDYLLGLLIDRQRAMIVESEQCVQELAANAMAQAVAQEAVGSAKAHLDSLLELQQPADE